MSIKAFSAGVSRPERDANILYPTITRILEIMEEYLHNMWAG
jgi:hypothetical protein